MPSPFVNRSDHGKGLRKRKKGGSTSSSSSELNLRDALVGALVLFLVAWGCFIMYAHVAVESMHAKQTAGVGPGVGGAGNKAGTVAEAVADAVVEELRVPKPETKNPWEGWQPPIKEMECSWRECFKKPHDCRTCRDLEEDMGPAPPVDDGWIPDVTVLRRMFLRGLDSNGNQWPPPLPDELCEAIGFDGGKDDVNGRLLKAVPISAQPMNKDPAVAAAALSNNKVATEGRIPTILCLVYTMQDAHATSIRAIRETWGGGCDGFLAFSTESDPRIPAISLPHDGPEEYMNMWQKVRSIWRFVGTHYVDDFDFFFIGGDDLMVLPQNLREYLATVGSPDDDHFVGRRFKSNVYFNSGGSGYALSRGTLRKFAANLDNDKCNPKGHTSMEDVMIAECLRKALGISFTDTRDDQGRERFHPFAPGTHLTWKPPKEGEPRDWYEQYNKEWGVKLGKDCCAPDSVSFHYMKKPAMVRHIYSLLYKCSGPVDRGNLRGDGNI